MLVVVAAVMVWGSDGTGCEILMVLTKTMMAAVAGSPEIMVTIT